MPTDSKHRPWKANYHLSEVYAKIFREGICLFLVKVPYNLRKIKGQLPDDLFIRIYKDLVLEKIGASEIVFNIGDIGRKMYFIIEGEVAILIPMQESPVENTSKSIKN